MTSEAATAGAGGGIAGIVPRWEWRTFGDGFGDTEGQLAVLESTGVEDSRETYLVSTRADTSVKVRGGLMDVKRLEQVGDDGLEQWRPVMKASFPISADDAVSVLEALAVAMPALARNEYTLEELLDEVVGPIAELQAVNVEKTRRHYLVDGCMVELTDVATAGAAARTIAIESEDPALVVTTVNALGLAGRRNVSFPRGLKTLVGIGAQRYAVIDVGTNSVKFHVGELRADGSWWTRVDRAEVTRLGEGLAETGRLQTGPIERTAAAIADMAAEVEREGVADLAAVGTAGMRAAPNAAELIEAVKARCGVEIEVISGEEEARLAYLATTSALHLPAAGSLAVFDTGGGSSQFTFGSGDHVDERWSVEVGAVRFTERFGLSGVVSGDELASARDAIAADLARLDGRATPDTVIGMGGAVTNLAAVKHGLATYDADVVQGTVLDSAELDRQIALYSSSSVEERRRIVGLQPKRAEVILAGACIVRTVLARLGVDSLVVSDRGLRHGLLAERFGRT